MIALVGGVAVHVKCGLLPHTGQNYGQYDPGTATITIDSRYDSSRARRALLHEYLHVLDEAYDIRLTHKQIREIAAGLAASLEDPRNKQLNTFLTGGTALCRPT